VTTIVTAPQAELGAMLRSYRYDVSPVFDDSPFFWHFARFRDVFARRDARPNLDPEDGFGERMLLALLAMSAAYALVFLLLPFVVIRRTWAALPYKLPSAVYFAAVGTGFMFFEIVMIQKLTLLLGYPTYSLSVTLAALLVFSGAGSFLAPRLGADHRRATLALLAVVAAATVAYGLGLSAVIEAALPASLSFRVALAVATLMPLGLCLGAFMPIGLALVAARSNAPQEYVAWGWALNGFFSVISSMLATVLSMTFGFTTVMALALALYAVATLALWAVPSTAVPSR
jgi:hypothetical protein